MPDYSEGLNWDAKARAEYCGICFGWVQNPGEKRFTGGQVVRAACNHCGILVEETWTSGVDENEVEARVWGTFREKAPDRQFPHLIHSK